MVGVRDADGPTNGTGGCVAFANIVEDAESDILLGVARNYAFPFCDWGEILRFSSFDCSKPRFAFPLAARATRMYVTKKGSHVHFILTGFLVTLVAVELCSVFGGAPDLDVSCSITLIELVGIQFKPAFADSFSLAVPSVHSGAGEGVTRAVEVVIPLRLPPPSF